jgi:signal transduction histidine kinase/CheY-like chemotaxis protein
MRDSGHNLQGWRTKIIFLICFCALMVALAEIGTALSQGNLGFSTLWPPSGLYFMALTFAANSTREWIGIIVASAISNLISDWWIQEYSLAVTLCFVASNTISATIAALVARRFIFGRQSIDNLATIFVLLLCGLLIQAPIAATFGLWFQELFWDQPWTWLKWVAWWSSNAIGVSCFGLISFYWLHRIVALILKMKRPEIELINNWNAHKGTRVELVLLWTSFLALAGVLLYELIPPWGVFLLNVLILIWTFRFGILHSSLVLAVGCLIRIYHATSSWEYLRPLSGILLLNPPNSPELLKIVTVISVQLFLIEHSVVVNIAAALFTDFHVKQNALMEAAESRERLMARMSHEIRTPLSGVLGLIEAWAIKKKSKQRSHDLQMILNSASQLKRVIDDVLDFSKLSAGKMTIEPVQCNLHDLFSEIISLHSSDATRKKITLELEMAEDLPDEIMIDSLRLRQIVNNLVANSIKFTLRGFVRIRVQSLPPTNQRTHQIEIRVEDTGIGISKSAMLRLFRPFEQIGTETTRSYGGTGLGLAICRELTDLFGGRIEVESDLDVGTVFTVQLPFSEVLSDTRINREIHQIDAPPTPRSKKRRKHILIVEDDPINQIVATRFIEAEGYIARVVDNGFQALELLEKHRNEFALVLMDYFMPVMDGCEVTRRYRSSEESEEKGSHLPIVGLTASILAVDHQRCRQAGMDDVLLKPIGREALRAALIKYVAA